MGTRLSQAAIAAVRKANAARLNLLIPRYTSVMSSNIINPELCERALDKIDFSAYKNPIIVDINPGLSVWSAALHDRLKPRAHVLIEPEPSYAPILDEFTATRPNAYWLPLDGYDWSTYTTLFSPTPPSPPWPPNCPPFDPLTVPHELGLNTDLIFTGNLSMTSVRAGRLLAQFLNCCAHGQWVQKFGRVRWLMWVQDMLKERYLPRGIGGRGRATAIADTLTEVTEIASNNTVRSGRGHPRTMGFDQDGNLLKPPPRHQVLGRPPVAGGKKKKKEESGKSRLAPMSIEAIRQVVERIEAAQGDHKAQRALVKELNSKVVVEKPERGPEKKKLSWDPPDKAPEPVEVLPTKNKRIRRTIAQIELAKAQSEKMEEEAVMEVEVEEGEESVPSGPSLRVNPPPDLRVKLTALLEGNDPTVTSLVKKMIKRLEVTNRSLSRKTEKLNTDLTNFLTSTPRWIPGMEHPPWWYLQDPTRMHALAATMARAPKSGYIKTSAVRSLIVSDLTHALSTLEEPSLDAPAEPCADYDTYNAIWGRRSDGQYMLQTWEDESLAFSTKLLQWHRRPFEPIPVEESDFHPLQNGPLVLLQFDPVALDPFFSTEIDESERVNNWEVYSWMLRHLFTLRASSLSGALTALAPGGADLLKFVDKEVGLDPETRPRMLRPDQFVALARAWQKWPLKGDFDHLESPMEDEPGTGSRRNEQKKF